MVNDNIELSFSQRMCAFRRKFNEKLAPVERRFSSITSKISGFYYSNWYLLLLLVVSIVSWYFDASVVGMAILACIGAIVLVTNKDITPIIPIMPLMLMVVSKNTFLKNPNNITAVAVLGTIFAIGILFNIIFYRQTLRSGKLTIPFIMVSIALFLGGIFSPWIDKYMDGMVFMISLGPLMLGVYVYIMSCAKLPKRVDSRMYFAKLIVLIAAICSLQVLISHIRIGGELIDHFRALLDVGWTNRAGLVIMLTLGLAPAFYYADNVKRGNFILFNFAFSIYLALMFTCGRGGMIFGTLEMFVIIVYLFAKGKHKIQFGVTFGIWALSVLIAVGIEYDVVLDLIDKFKDLGLNSSGRTSLFAEAWELFKKYPIFGVGFGYRGEHYFDEDCIYWFHSTILQVLASMGITGLIAYGTYYIERLRILLYKRNPFNIMMIFALGAFEVHSLIDAGTFEPLPFLFTAVLINTFVEFVNREEDDDALNTYLDDMQGRTRLANARREAMRKSN